MFLANINLFSREANDKYDNKYCLIHTVITILKLYTSDFSIEINTLLNLNCIFADGKINKSQSVRANTAYIMICMCVDDVDASS